MQSFIRYNLKVMALKAVLKYLHVQMKLNEIDLPEFVYFGVRYKWIKNPKENPGRVSEGKSYMSP